MSIEMYQIFLRCRADRRSVYRRSKYSLVVFTGKYSNTRLLQNLASVTELAGHSVHTTILTANYTVSRPSIVNPSLLCPDDFLSARGNKYCLLPPGT